MSQESQTNGIVSDKDLRQALQDALPWYVDGLGRIVGIERRPYAYRSSFALEEVDVHFDDGPSLKILFKDLSRHALHEGARQAKPAFLYNPLREIDTYRFILTDGLPGPSVAPKDGPGSPSHSTARFYGAAVDVDAGRYWLFLEKVSGRELYQVGEIELWQEAARWLAGFHSRFAGSRLEKLATNGLWTRYDEDYYRLWLQRAATHVQGLDRLTHCYDEVVQRLAALPATFIHGEFYASNILVDNPPPHPYPSPPGGRGEGVRGVRVCPVDWEMAAIGPGLIDLAALTAGSWQAKEADRRSIALAYRQALPANGNSPAEEDFLAALDLCQLHLAVQWLGWSVEWEPPPQHAQDWRSEALRLADKLGL